MVIGDALRRAAQQLAAAGIQTAMLDARVLLMDVLKADGVYLAVHRADVLMPEQQECYESAVRRRTAHEPVAYITGEREFMSLSFLVQKGVLIPRPDTEILAEYAIVQCRGLKRPAVLDICTGSGALAVSIAHAVPEAQVTAVDISDTALAVAARNAARNGVEVAVVKMDVLRGLNGLAGRFDVVVSNPPYVRREEIGALEPDVREFEPMLALDGGADGLEFYRALVRHVPQRLKKGGVLAFEVGYDQAAAVSSLMADNFEKLEWKRDLAGHVRVVAGCLR